MRPGPQTNRTVLTVVAGTDRLPLLAAPNTLPTAAVTVPSSPPWVALPGYSNISSAAMREYTPLTCASAPEAFPSAMESAASRARVNVNDSPGFPFTASGFVVVWLGPAAGGSGWVQACDMDSGLYWNTMTFGIGMSRVGMNSTSAPRI